MQALSHRIGATVVVLRRDGKAPRAEYRDLFPRLDFVNREFFAMTKCIVDVAVKLPVLFDGAVDTIIEKFLAYLFPIHVYLELKDIHGDGIRRITDAIIGAHAAHVTASAVSAPSSSPLPRASRRAPQSPPHPSFLGPLTTLLISTPSAASANFYLSNVDVVIAQMLQKSVALLVRHADNTASYRRDRLRAEKFTALRQGLKETIAVPLMREWPRKHHRDTPEESIPDNIVDNHIKRFQTASKMRA